MWPRGDTLSTPDTAEARKARGAFFTPPALTDFMARWAVRSRGDRVLEPSCGEAAFLLAAARALQAHGEAAPALTGYDVHGPSLAAAAEHLAAVGAQADLGRRDFFEVPAAPSFDAVLGNPPYLRYQAFSGAARERGRAVARGHGVSLPGLANAWAAFVVHAAEFLSPGGRLALVLPAVLLSVNYAAPVRRYLARRFQRVRLILFEERVFPGVQEEVVLLLAEGPGPTDGLEVVQVTGARDLATLDAPTRRHGLAAGGKWTAALLPPGDASAWEAVLTESGLGVLGDWGRTDLGMVTGNNRYFALSAAEVQQHGLPDGDLLPIAPPGARHLQGLRLSETDLARLTASGRKTRLFRPGDQPSPSGRAYIQSGERQGVHRAYKCRVRAPWWRVPLTAPPDLILTYMSGEAPRLLTNEAGVRCLNSVHGVTLDAGRRDLGRELLPLALLSSASLVGAELEGRSYGGGVLKLEPREAARLPCPTPALLRTAAPLLRDLASRIERLVLDGDLGAASALVDGALLVTAAGVDRPLVQRLAHARTHLRQRRAARGRAPRRS